MHLNQIWFTALNTSGQVSMMDAEGLGPLLLTWFNFIPSMDK